MNLEQARSLDAKALHKAAAKLKPETRHFIDGKFVSSKKGKTFQTINPATGDVIAEVARGDASDVDAAVKAARKAFKSGVWSRMAPRDRMAVVYKFAKLIEDNALEFALLDTTDMGKPISEMLNIDIPGAVMTFNYFGETIDKIAGQVTETAATEFHYILRQPLGVVGCIVPWNYPLMMAAWKTAPALAAGNSVIL
ncbi:MAG TPA: aldehyde dehydrogenase family protein, partial [Dongiaceae bacterium]|nr:aldehyde dehydrogenase family protein [Dongiaceae bacterium]